MRFLVDECAGVVVARWLRDQGHDVFSVYEESRGLDDQSVLNKAYAEERILVTNDKDFGELVYRNRLRHKGVILLRLADSNPRAMIAALQRVFAEAADRIAGAFTVVTERSIRVVTPPPFNGFAGPPGPSDE